MVDEKELMIFSGTSHPNLAQKIALHLGTDLGKVRIEKFPDDEIGIQIEENVRGRDVFVVQSIARRPNLYLMELLILIDALKRASAHSIVAVIPYYGYARQDRKDKGRVPITAKLIANLLEKAGATRVLTMGLHTDQIEGFFDIPCDNLSARPVLVERVEREGLDHPVIVCPDVGNIRLAREFAGAFESEFAIVDKRRVSSTRIESGALIGEVKGRDVVLVDDMCTTGGTITTAARVCRTFGAQRIVAAVTHGLILGERVGSEWETLIATDTVVSLPKEKGSKRVTVAPSLPMLSVPSRRHGRSPRFAR